MQRTLIHPNFDEFPEEICNFIKYSDIYDSSCSSEAKVFYIDKEQGYYLKKAEKGALEKEAALTAYFNKKGLSAKVLGYISKENDWLLTEALHGEDGINPDHLANPKKLCDTIAENLRMLHSIDFTDCPVQDRNADYISFAEKTYATKEYNPDYSPDYWGYSSYDAAWQVVYENKNCLKRDVLLHGDYCLPNIILNDWKLSGFIDLGNGGVGDRHIDLFWGAWTLNFNLKTDKYRDRFLDAYGRNDIDTDMFRIIAAIETFG